MFMSFWAEPLFPLGSPAWLVMTVAIVVCVIIILSWHRLRRFVSAASPMTGLLVFIIAGAIVGGAGGAVLWFYAKGQIDVVNAQHALVVRPIEHDASIKFDDTRLLPSEEKSRPFSFKAVNLGSSKITHVKLNFELVDVDVRHILESSKVFEDLKINKYNEAWILTEAKETGNSHGMVSLSSTGELIIDAIPAHGQLEIEFELPNTVKSALSIFMISDSYQKAESREDSPKFDALKEWTLSNGDLDRLREIQDEFRYDDWREMPDLSIQASYKSAENTEITQSIMIKSIYLFALPAMWWPKEDTRTLNGGAGILSYQNPNQPDKGYYNAWERRKGISE